MPIRVLQNSGGQRKRGGSSAQLDLKNFFAGRFDENGGEELGFRLHLKKKWCKT